MAFNDNAETPTYDADMAYDHMLVHGPIGNPQPRPLPSNQEEIGSLNAPPPRLLHSSLGNGSLNVPLLQPPPYSQETGSLKLSQSR